MRIVAIVIPLALGWSLVPCLFARWLAAKKNRDTIAWTLLTLFFGLVALITLAGAPSLESQK